jgi:mannose-6-phosphate isomerase-like protein (cupin superfamily)
VFVRDIKDCKEIIARDNTILRQLLHPDKEDIKIHFSLAQAIVKPRQTSLPHKLKISEVYYIVEGEAVMYIDDESKKVHPDYVVYIPPNATQYIKNIGDCDLKFLCIVDPAWQEQDEEVL